MWKFDWSKRCESKNTQSCRQGNRLCKSSPYLLRDYGEKEARKRKSGACRRSEPSAAESDCTKPARACGALSEWSARLERLVTAKWLSRAVARKRCV